MPILINRTPEDGQFADKLRSKLHIYGYKQTWVDHIDAPSGTERMEVIQQVLKESSVMLMVASSALMASDRIALELDTFRNKWKRPVFLLMTENCPIPDKLKSLQRFDFTNQTHFDYRFRELLAVLWPTVWVAETRLVADLIQDQSAMPVKEDELKLVIPVIREEIICKLDQPLRVGRSHKTIETPDIDFVGHDRKYGVSRSHAVFTYKNGRLYVTDSRSKNGTFVCGQRLVSGVPRMLSDGDIVHFGGLGTQVYFGEHEATGVKKTVKKPKKKSDEKPKKKPDGKYYGPTGELDPSYVKDHLETIRKEIKEDAEDMEGTGSPEDSDSE